MGVGGWVGGWVQAKGLPVKQNNKIGSGYISSFFLFSKKERESVKAEFPNAHVRLSTNEGPCTSFLIGVEVAGG